MSLSAKRKLARSQERSGDPAAQVRAVTPNNDTDLPYGVAKCLYVTAEGTLSLIAELDEAAINWGDVQRGEYILVRTRRVLATGTSATVLALY